MAKIVLQCMCCQEPFEREPRGDEECEMIRRLLLICDNTFRPPICDGCLSSTRGATSKHLGGESDKNFHDSPNYLLRHRERFPNGDPNG